jgi:hypothetical protein
LLPAAISQDACAVFPNSLIALEFRTPPQRGERSNSSLLTTNLNEEKAADKKLSTVALRKDVNQRAAS